MKKGKIYHGYREIPSFDRALFCYGRKPSGEHSNESLNAFWGLVEKDESLNLFEKLSMLFLLSSVIDRAFAETPFTEGYYNKLKGTYLFDVFRVFNKEITREYKFIHWFRKVFKCFDYGSENITASDNLLEAVFKLFIFSKVDSLTSGFRFFSITRELQEALCVYLKKVIGEKYKFIDS